MIDLMNMVLLETKMATSQGEKMKKFKISNERFNEAKVLDLKAVSLRDFYRTYSDPILGGAMPTPSGVIPIILGGAKANELLKPIVTVFEKVDKDIRAALNAEAPKAIKRIKKYIPDYDTSELEEIYALAIAPVEPVVEDADADADEMDWTKVIQK